MLILRFRTRRPRRGGGFTLLEVLVAAVVTLILTALVVEMFAIVSDGIFNSRANIEISDQLRNAKHRLIQDLRGVTAPTIPPLDPYLGCGYFEYVEGGNVANTIGGDTGAGTLTKTSGGLRDVHTVFGDLDDILMFTTCSFDEPYVGKYGTGRTHRTRFAEVAWSARSVGTQPFATLHRAVFLVDPQASISATINRNNGLVTSAHDGYNDADISTRQHGGYYETLIHPSHQMEKPRVVRNSLGDLTRRECRSLHQPNAWPYEMLYATQINTASAAVVRGALSWPSGSTPLMGLPTMMEYGRSTANFPNPIDKQGYYSTTASLTTLASPPNRFQTPGLTTNFAAPSGTLREAEDIVLTNVIGFDVKAWDPGAPVFRAAPATVGGNAEVVGLIVPGDGGYGGDGKMHNGTQFPKGALANFIEKSTTVENQPVAFGAYVDLNYMWLNGQSGEDNVMGPNSQMANYYKALRAYSQKAVSNRTLARLPRPSFAFATPGRVLSGYPVYTSGPNRGRPNHTVVGYQLPAVWDTWSRHYEYDGIDNDFDGFIDEGFDGIDNNGNGYIDEPPVAIDLSSPADGVIDGAELFAAEANGERDAPPPYDAPLRGIKVTIRVMEQDSRQVREVSTVHEFIPY